MPSSGYIYVVRYIAGRAIVVTGTDESEVNDTMRDGGIELSTVELVQCAAGAVGRGVVIPWRDAEKPERKLPDWIDPTADIVCGQCQFEGTIHDYEPSMRTHSDIQCPKCHSTDNSHNTEFKRRCFGIK